MSESNNPHSPPPKIELRKLTRRYPSGSQVLTVLDSVDLSIQTGETVAVLGPSGSGKSTLLALIAGLDRPSEGQVLLDGLQIQDLGEDDLALMRRRQVGFVFQTFQLLTNMTALENVLLPLDLAEIPDAEERAMELLTAVQLRDRSHHYPGQLSGGEQQRVALARAFATRPPILLADEPTGNLDAATGAVVLEILAELKSSHGTTLVLVTHDPQVARIADRTLELSEGRLAP